ncbi:MAG: hypothetical protein JSW39_10865, partial [Desulfobacterales bacterium]
YQFGCMQNIPVGLAMVFQRAKPLPIFLTKKTGHPVGVPGFFRSTPAVQVFPRSRLSFHAVNSGF